MTIIPAKGHKMSRLPYEVKGEFLTGIACGNVLDDVSENHDDSGRDDDINTNLCSQQKSPGPLLIRKHSPPSFE
jgi:hypothetical protein